MRASALGKMLQQLPKSAAHAGERRKAQNAVAYGGDKGSCCLLLLAAAVTLIRQLRAVTRLLAMLTGICRRKGADILHCLISRRQSACYVWISCIARILSTYLRQPSFRFTQSSFFIFFWHTLLISSSPPGFIGCRSLIQSALQLR